MAPIFPDVSFDIVAAAICTVLILSRCTYRILYQCHLHPTCHRRWRVDDSYMAFALLPLLVRTSTMVVSFVLSPDHVTWPATEAEVAAKGPGWTAERLNRDRVMSRLLLIPGRVMYALFLWSLKLCLLAFYARFIDVLSWGKPVIRTLWWTIVLSFIAILIATLTECRPLKLGWELAPKGHLDSCNRGLVNLLTMAIFNIVTDVALIILPFPMLRKVRLDKRSRIQLACLFSIGLIVVIVTITRVPFILSQHISQRSRSLWATIEILSACVVANTAFFYTLVKDFSSPHSHSSRGSAGNPHDHSRNFYLESLPSSHICHDEDEEGEGTTGSSSASPSRTTSGEPMKMGEYHNRDAAEKV